MSSITWGAVCRPKKGQSVCGDTFVVASNTEHNTLIAVIDGLGGGQEAAVAAERAAGVLRDHPEYSLTDLLHKAHQALHHTRGAVIGVMQLDLRGRRASYMGVGNIGVQSYSSQSIKPISKNGILGYKLPSLLQLNYSYNSGDTFVLYSDGVSSKFGNDDSLDISLTPNDLAQAIVQRYGKDSDDATVLVVRCP
ncbi:MAG: SpoIIE family protein phosphatase [Chloroflexaceae bacterium]|jgi:serine/threonine protein phosphatase PrpC|nr:SpoIIE family protein phosphatase [Chloroflexaceae bacterium]